MSNFALNLFKNNRTKRKIKIASYNTYSLIASSIVFGANFQVSSVEVTRIALYISQPLGNVLVLLIHFLYAFLFIKTFFWKPSCSSFWTLKKLVSSLYSATICSSPPLFSFLEAICSVEAPSSGLLHASSYRGAHPTQSHFIKLVGAGLSIS